MYTLRNQHRAPHRLSIVVTLLIILLSVLPTFAGAQEPVDVLPPDPVQEPEGTPRNQCLDSEGVSFEQGTLAAMFGRLDLRTTSAGSVTVPVTLTNQSSEVYVPNASVIALVYDEQALNLETPVVPVDWFVVDENITVLPHENERIDLTWNVPDYLGAGSYRIVLHHGQFSVPDVLARGMTDVQGMGSVPVSVTGPAVRSRVVDPLSVQMSGDGLSPSRASFLVKNHLTEQSIRGDVSWAVYDGNAPFLSRKIEQGREEIKLTPTAERVYDIEIPDSDLDVRLLLVTITTDAPEQLLIPIYLIPEGISVSYQQPHVSFVGVQGDTYVACAYLGNQNRYLGDETESITFSLSNNDNLVTTREITANESDVLYAVLSHPLQGLQLGYETLALKYGEEQYDQMTSLVCESDLCTKSSDSKTYKDNTSQVPFNQSFSFYILIVLVSALLGYVVLRRLPV